MASPGIAQVAREGYRDTIRKEKGGWVIVLLKLPEIFVSGVHSRGSGENLFDQLYEIAFGATGTSPD